MSLNTDSSSFRFVTALSMGRGPRACVRLARPSRAVRSTGQRRMREPYEFPGKHMLPRRTTGPVGSALASLPTGLAGRNRPLPVSEVSAPADIRGGDVVAEERTFGLNDVLSART